MAAIDKITGTKEQYLQLKEWLQDNHKGLLIHLYDACHEEDHNEERTISNFSTEANVYLYNYCPFKWVVDAIYDQYGGAPMFYWRKGKRWCQAQEGKK